LKIKRLIASFFFLILTLITIRPGEQAVPVRGSEAVVASNDMGIDLRETLVQAILRAKSSITLSIYSISDREIIAALRKQADAGVIVKVICDSSVSIEGLQRLGDKAKIVIRESGGLMHQKILVIDHEEVWIGSANMTGDSLREHRNLMIGFYEEKMAVDLEKGLGRSPVYGFYQVGGQQVEMRMLPDKGAALDRVAEMIRGAKKSVRVAMFTWTHPKLTGEIIAAHARGVRVKVILDTRQVYAIKAKAIGQMYQAGVDVSVNKGGELLHHKFAVIDSALVMGSANWTKAAFEVNDEIVMIWQEMTAGQKGAVEKIWRAVERGARPIGETNAPGIGGPGGGSGGAGGAGGGEL
jgi:cardiolipin synthase